MTQRKLNAEVDRIYRSRMFHKYLTKTWGRHQCKGNTDCSKLWVIDGMMKCRHTVCAYPKVCGCA